MIIGVFDKMIQDTVSMWCGYAQIHHSGYWDNKSVDSSFAEDPKLIAMLNNNKDITAWTPHLETFELASSGERTKGALVIGIEPGKENRVSNLSKKIIAGKYLNDSDKGIIMGEGLAEYLKLKVNDTVILLGQGYEGNMAAGKYPIIGIAKLGIPDMDKTMAWLPMAKMRDFLSTGARYTSISMMVDNRNKVDKLKQNLKDQTKDSDYEVMTWKEMNPGLDQIFQLKMGQNEIMSGILYLVIAFGIFGTILMMMNERMHEFGILIAIGMGKGVLSGIVVMELVLMSIVGTILGIAGAFPIVLYYRVHPIVMGGDYGKIAGRFGFEPIIQPNIDISNFIGQGYIVLSIAIVLSFYAIYKIHKIIAIAAINS
jgi:ABC-type lipoprotein release transport system permease subunit